MKKNTLLLIAFAILAVALFAYLFSGAFGSAKTPSDQVSQSDIKASFAAAKPSSTDVSAEDGQTALDFFKTEGVEMGSVSGTDGSYVLTDVTMDDLRAKTVTVTGLQMIDEEMPYAQSVEMESVKVDDVSINRIVLTLPDADLMKNLDTGSDEDIAMMNLFMRGTSAGYMEGMSYMEDDANVDIAFLGWDKNTETFSFLMEDLELQNASEYGDGPKAMLVEHMSLTNAKMGEMNEINERNAMSAMMGAYMKFSNPFERGYDSFAIRNLEIVGFDGDNNGIKIPAADVWYTEDRGGVYQFNAEANDMVITLDTEDMGGDMDPAILQDMDLNPLVLSYNANMDVDRNNDMLDLTRGGLKIHNNFEYNFKYKVEGMNNLFGNMGPMMAFFVATPMDHGNRNQTEEQMEAALKKLVVYNGSVEFKDLSLMGKMFKLAAAESGMSEDQIRQSLKDSLGLGTMAVQSEYQADLVKQFISATSAFIDNSGSLTISMNPINGWRVGESIAAAQQSELNGDYDAFVDDVLREMNLSFEHNY